MKTSIVIPVHGRSALTRRCLEWLARDVRDDPDVEAIVVDDGSPDDTHDVVEAAGWVTLVTHERPLGFASACNSGAAAADGEYLVFLNNDTEGQGSWLRALVKRAAETPEAGAVGAKLLYANDTVQHAGIVISLDLLPRHVYRGFAADHPAVSRSRRFQAVTAACLLVRRHLFEELAGFDTGFSNGFEDVDLCLRMSRAGHEIHFCAESVLVHDEAATRGENREAFERNAERYLDRWRDELLADELATYVDDGLLVIEPGDLYPLRVNVAPELAVVETDAVDAFRLLRVRAAQSFDLIKENVRLRNMVGGEDDV